MNNRISTISISLSIWCLTALFTSISIFVGISISEGWIPLYIMFFMFLGCCIASLPALILLYAFLGRIRDSEKQIEHKIYQLLRLLLFIGLLYALGLSFLNQLLSILSKTDFGFLHVFLLVAAGLFFLSVVSLAICWKRTCSYLDEFYGYYYPMSQFLNFHSTSKKTINMEPDNLQPQQPAPTNRTMIKGFITGGLILLMMIPTLFITSLIKEREQRQQEVVREVSSKWAAAQTLSCPFLVVPYSYPFDAGDGKISTAKSRLIFLANDAVVNGKIIPEERPRSIYKVLLYKSDIHFNGSFKVSLPADIDSSKIDYAAAKLCFTLSDFKGIEEEIYVTLNQQKLLLLPGIPVTDFGKTGLSVPVKLTAEQLSSGVAFNMQVKIKGSEQLHFTPMSASSKFNLQSTWPSPSFDGEMLPNERSVTDQGFSSKWSFNQANLPFATVIKENTVADKKLDFGVSLVQPADQYGKTMRSVKYAILFIGLTFAFFFIIELMQKKPFHPVQYVLVGIALVIFYTLLLSISEYIPFDYAYLLSSLATISLISLYAKGHFKSWKTAGIFFALLSLLYGFIFILIRLEDTALLVGSIGLFLVLALVMFASRRINWYGQTYHSIHYQTPENV
ncbi:MAG: cell envelope integrity protein CreD [Chitinophagaceae bacterium]|nr:MAG: cell envelope integrity protein CreD [Chitinophagaceae bacterium]